MRTTFFLIISNAGFASLWIAYSPTEIFQQTLMDQNGSNLHQWYKHEKKDKNLVGGWGRVLCEEIKDDSMTGSLQHDQTHLLE